MQVDWSKIKEWFDLKQLTPSRVLVYGMVLIFISAVIFTSVSFFDYRGKLAEFNSLGNGNIGELEPGGEITTPSGGENQTPSPAPSHLECRNRQCVQIAGAGLDFTGCRGKAVGAACSSGGGSGGGPSGPSGGETCGNAVCAGGETCASCSADCGQCPANTFSLIVNLIGSGSGSINVNNGLLTCSENVCSGVYSAGTSITILAISAAGSIFGGWSGDCTGTQNQCTLQMTANYVATALFNLQGSNQPPVVSLTASPSNGNAPLDVTFTLEANDPDGGALVGATLDFGDGSTPFTATDLTNSISLDILHTYQNSNTAPYVAIARVTDDEGEITEMNVQISVSASAPLSIPVCTIGELNGIRNDLSANYELVCNIDVGSIRFSPIGTDAVPFTGNFEGNGKTISGLGIGETALSSVGLFGAASGEISNVELRDVNINGANNVGALVGNLLQGGYVYKSSSTGQVKGQNNVGGLVGLNDRGLVEQSNSRADVTGELNVGGLAGYAKGIPSARDDVVLDSYARGKIVASDYMGGLIGKIEEADITRTYATGLVSAGGQSEPTNIGGLIGGSVSSTVTDSYFDSETTGQQTSAGGEVRVTAQMYEQSNYVNWDFDSVWAPIIDVDYPILQWELPLFAPAGEPRFFTPAVVLVLVIHLIVLIALVLVLLFIVWQHKKHQQKIEMLMNKRNEAMLPSLKSPIRPGQQ